MYANGLTRDIIDAMISLISLNSAGKWPIANPFAMENLGGDLPLP